MTENTTTGAWRTVETLGVKPGDVIRVHYIWHSGDLAGQDDIICLFVAIDEVGIYVRDPLGESIELWPWSTVHKVSLTSPHRIESTDARRFRRERETEEAKKALREKERQERLNGRVGPPPRLPPVPEPPTSPYDRPHP